MADFNIGSVVAFDLAYVYAGLPTHGRVLAVTDTEYAVTVGLDENKQHVCWIAKDEAREP